MAVVATFKTYLCTLNEIEKQIYSLELLGGETKSSLHTKAKVIDTGLNATIHIVIAVLALTIINSLSDLSEKQQKNNNIVVKMNQLRINDFLHIQGRS